MPTLVPSPTGFNRTLQHLSPTETKAFSQQIFIMSNTMNRVRWVWGKSKRPKDEGTSPSPSAAGCRHLLQDWLLLATSLHKPQVGLIVKGRELDFLFPPNTSRGLREVKM